MKGLSSNHDLLHEAREITADVHHRLRQEKATGDADALAHLHALARESGATPQELSQIRGGFPRIAEELTRLAPRRRRAPWRWRRSSSSQTNALAPPDQRRELPPGPG